MGRCACIKIDGTQCTRNGSIEPTHHPAYCWQHQKCKNVGKPMLPVGKVYEIPVEKKLITPPEWDWDKFHPIPESMKNLEYLYAAGSSKTEVARYWILPPDWPLSVQGLRRSSKKQIMSVTDYFKLLEINQGLSDEDRDYYVYRVVVDGKNLGYHLGQILPSDPRGKAEIILSSRIHNMKGEAPIYPQIRKNGKIVKQYTSKELDELAKI